MPEQKRKSRRNCCDDTVIGDAGDARTSANPPHPLDRPIVGIDEHRVGNPSRDVLNIVDLMSTLTHRSLRSQLRRLVTLVGKVGAIGGERRQELTEMRRLFRHLRISLEANLSREEHMLLPMVRQLVVHTHSRVHDQGLDSQLALLWAGHEAIRTHLGALRRVTGGYYVPSDGCRYESCYVALANLDRDTQRHLSDVEQLVVPAVHMWRVNSPCGASISVPLGCDV